MGRSVRSTVGDRVLLLSEVARLYYVEDLTQAAIARRMGVSRSNVSRMLKEARKRGLVEIRVRSPFRMVDKLQNALKESLNLQDCLVLAHMEYDGGENEPSGYEYGIGALAAQYLQDNLAEGGTIGVGWSNAVYRVVTSKRWRPRKDVTVVQLMGSIGGTIPELNGVHIAAQLASALGAKVHYLHAPMVVADTGVRNGLLRDQHISRTLEMARRADIMVVGIGAINRDSGQYRAGYLNDADLEYIRGNGVVGDVCGAYFSLGGEVLHLEMNDRTVALDPESVKGIPIRVGVSWGEKKVVPNIGAARAGLINVLITDEETASGMLRFLEREKRV